LMGFGEDKLQRLGEVIEEFKKLSENPVQNSNNNVKIVKGEKELLKNLENGWTLVKELNHGKYLLRS